MKQFRVKIHTEKYMQHRMDDQKLEEWEKNRGKIIERDDVNQEDLVRAEFHCYRNSKGECFVPSEHIKQSLINGGTQVKAKVGNGRKSMTNIVAGLFTVSPEEIIVRDFDTIDKRSAVNRNVKARIIAIRPRWNDLSLSFTINVKNDTITKQTVESILEFAGTMFGIGSYRPEHKGEFGVFEVVEFKQVK
ncbi:MAG: hypothetical protein DRI97_06120 [Bacteroidetes bacterium]|nr:MAG: hypothetical protein DRI97_06120 [Bacteroidota bacterium]